MPLGGLGDGAPSSLSWLQYLNVTDGMSPSSRSATYQSTLSNPRWPPEKGDNGELVLGDAAVSLRLSLTVEGVWGIIDGKGILHSVHSEFPSSDSVRHAPHDAAEVRRRAFLRGRES